MLRKLVLTVVVLLVVALGGAAAGQTAYGGRGICYSCWERVAECESGNDWDINTGNGYYGGLQFLPSTWRAYGGLRYASMPHYATKSQQIAIASTMSLRHWPVCGRRYYG